VGSEVTWTYQVTNLGNVPLRNVIVTDDQPDAIPSPVFMGGFNAGDTNADNLLDPGEVWIYTASGVVIEGQYTNLGTTSGEDNTNTIPGTQEWSNSDHYFGSGPGPGPDTPTTVLGPDKNPGTPQYVMVVDGQSGEVSSQFLAYESDYVGGTRVAVADLDGDGVDEIITAPGRNRPPEVRVFDVDGNSVPGFPSFLGNSAAFTGGIHLTVADVNGDGKPDIITVPSYGAADVRIFLNRYPQIPAFQATPEISFLAFPTASIGGAVVAAADMGQMVNGSFVNVPDGKAEIVIGTGPGSKATVTVFDVSGVTPLRVQTFFPFTALNPNFLGGVSLDLARIDADAIPDVIVGMGVNGTSRIEVWAWDTTSVSLSLLGTISAAFTGSSNNAPVSVAAMDWNRDGIADTIFGVQGPIGTTGEIHRFDITDTAPFQYLQAAPLTGFAGPWFIATCKVAAATPVPQPPLGVPPAVNVWTNPVNPYDVNNSGAITPLDVLETINYINANPTATELPDQQFSPPRFFDTNVDGAITASDVLLIVNYLRLPTLSSGEGETSESSSGIAAMLSRIDNAAGLAEAPRMSKTTPGRRGPVDQVLGSLDAGGTNEDWLWSAAEAELPPVLYFRRGSLDDLDLLDLESALEEIALEIAALGERNQSLDGSYAVGG